jgi:hypothetical protein
MDFAEKKTARLGYAFAVGVLRAVGLWLCIPALVYYVIIATFGLFTDDSDRSGWQRSGAGIITDYKTGLQYFAAPGGGITPRLNQDGSHMRATP